MACSLTGEKEVEARRLLEIRQVHKIAICHRRQLHKLPAAYVAQAAHPLSFFDAMGDSQRLERELRDEHRKPREDEEEEHTCTVER